MRFLLISLLTILTLVSLVTSIVYTVTPDDHYYPNTTCHHCHNLQHYLLNVTKYFTSNTQLLFLPGLHHLHTDLIIQNVHNISLIGSTANGTTLDTVIIHCNSSGGIIITNIVDLTVKNLTIKKCEIDTKILTKMLSNITISLHYTEKSIVLINCLNVELINITLHGKNQYYTHSLMGINVLGNSSFEGLTSNGFAVEYHEANVSGIYHKLLIKNYNTLDGNAIYRPQQSIIIVYMHQNSYRLELEMCNSKFLKLQHNGIFTARLKPNIFGNFIHINYFIIEELLSYYSGQETPFLIYTPAVITEPKCYKKTLIHFTNCKFQHNKLNLLLYMQGMLNIKLEKCVFAHSQFQILNAELFNQSTVKIMNTSFSFIINPGLLIEISNAALQLEGPIVFTEIERKSGIPNAAIIFSMNSVISIHHYIEFSEITTSRNLIKILKNGIIP